MALYHKFVTMGTGPNGVQWRWINYFQTSTDLTPNQTQMVAWMTACWATIKAKIAAGWSVYGIGYSPWIGTGALTDPKGWGATIVYPVTLAGEAQSESLPSQCAAVILGRTNTKRVIGKKFVPGVEEADQNAGVPSASMQTYLLNLGGFMYASTYDMSGTGLNPVVWGTHHGFVPTVSTSLSPFLGTQRRRKPGIGI